MNKYSYYSLHIGIVRCGNWGRNILRDLKQLGVKTSVVARSAASQTNATAYGADLPPLSSIEDELLIMRRITAVRNKLYGGEA